MSFAIINLLSNVFTTGFALIGICTTINKVGRFFKIIEENKVDGFKVGFDTLMLESLKEVNTSVESISIISSNITKIIIKFITFIFYF